MIDLRARWFVVPFLLAAVGCSSQAADPPEDHVPADPLVVRVEPATRSSIKVDEVRVSDIPMRLRTTGKVQFDERRVARVIAPIPGQVMDLTANVGDAVKRGQALFHLRSRDAASAIEDHFDARRDLELADKTYAMTKDLFDHGAASRMALQQAENDLAKAHARVTRAEGALRAIGLSPELADSGDPRVPVTSPIDGDVVERHVSDGQYVQPDPSPLLVIADLSTVWIEADVFEHDLHLIGAGQETEVTADAYPDDVFRGAVAHISDVVDPSTQTVKVRFRVANPRARLKPEMFTHVALDVGSPERGIAVPVSAVMTEGTRSFVYVALDDRSFARRAVEADPPVDGSRRIRSGLTPSDRIVTAGVVLLRGQEDRNVSK